MLTPERRKQMDAVLGKSTGLSPERRAQMDAVLGKTPQKSFLQKAGEFGKSILDQATGLPRLAFENIRGAANAIPLKMAESRLESIRKQPLTEDRVAQEERVAGAMQQMTKTSPFGLNESERSRTTSVPESVEMGVQKSLGTGSFLVPGASGAKFIPKAVSGAVTGAMSGASMGEDIDPRNIAFGAGVGVAVPTAIEGASKALQGVKSGSKYLSERLTTQGLGSPKTFRKVSGLNPEDSIFDLFEKHNLWDRLPQTARDAVNRVDKSYKGAISGSTSGMKLGGVVREFDNAIEELTPLARESDAVSNQIQELIKRRDALISKSKTFNIGAGGLYESKSAVSQDLVDSSFAPSANLKGTARGTKQSFDILKKSLGDVAPETQSLGREEGALIGLMDMFKSYQERGATRQALNFTKLGSAGVGGIVAGLPGMMGGYILESAVTSPTGTRVLAKTFNQLSKAEMDWLINVFNKVSTGSIVGGTQGISQMRNDHNPYVRKTTPNNSYNKSNKVKVEYKF